MVNFETFTEPVSAEPDSSEKEKDEDEKRYRIQRDQFVIERLRTLQSIIEEMRKEKPEVLSACLFGSSVHGRSKEKSDVDADIFIDVELINKSNEIKSSKDKAEFLNAYTKIVQEKMKELLKLSDEQVHHIRPIPISREIIDSELENFIKNGEIENAYKTAEAKYETDLKAWEKIYESETDFRKKGVMLLTRPIFPKPTEDTYTSSMLGHMFFLDVGSGIRPFRKYFLEKLKERGRSGEVAWDLLRFQDEIFDPLMPKTLEDALRIYS